MSKRNPALMFFSSRSGMTKLPIPSGKSESHLQVRPASARSGGRRGAGAVSLIPACETPGNGLAPRSLSQGGCFDEGGDPEDRSSRSRTSITTRPSEW